MRWSISQNEWEALLADSYSEAEKAIDTSRDDNLEAWNHAENLDIDVESRSMAIKYAQWSIASEKAALLTNGSEEQKYGALYGEKATKGRGVMPKLEMKSLAGKSSDLPVEHTILGPTKSASHGGQRSVLITLGSHRGLLKGNCCCNTSGSWNKWDRTQAKVHEASRLILSLS